MREIKEAAAPAKINKVMKKPAHSPGQKAKTDTKKRYVPEGQPVKVVTDCRYCGESHVQNKYKCPAWGKRCEKCKGRNYFAVKCKRVHAVSEDTDEAWLMSVQQGNTIATALMSVNDRDVRFQLDSGCDVNTVCQKHVRNEQTRPTNVKLKMWNKTKLQPLGETKL